MCAAQGGAARERPREHGRSAVPLFRPRGKHRAGNPYLLCQLVVRLWVLAQNRLPHTHTHIDLASIKKMKKTPLHKQTKLPRLGNAISGRKSRATCKRSEQSTLPHQILTCYPSSVPGVKVKVPRAQASRFTRQRAAVPRTNEGPGFDKPLLEACFCRLISFAVRCVCMQQRTSFCSPGRFKSSVLSVYRALRKELDHIWHNVWRSDLQCLLSAEVERFRDLQHE